MLISCLLPISITGVGLYLLIRLGFFPLLRPLRTAKEIRRAFREDGGSGAGRLFFALAGVLGVGNVTGVALGIQMGGAGVVFWIAVSSVLSSIIKFAESVLSLDALRKHPEPVGFLAAVRDCFPGKPSVAAVYGLSLLSLSLFMGAAVQSSAVGDALRSEGGIPSARVLPILSLFVLVFFFLPKRILRRFFSVFVPISCGMYIILCIFAIINGKEPLLSVFRRILREAFSIRKCGEGVLTFGMIRSVGEGFRRGLLSNEAGTGTSALSHTSDGAVRPVREGFVGMCEVVIDTQLLCPLTGVALLCALPGIPTATTPMDYVLTAFRNALGETAVFPLIFCLLCFAFSTVICWLDYGRTVFRHLFPKLPVAVFYLLFGVSLAFGSVGNVRLIISATDVLLLVMSLICLSVLQKNADRVVFLSAEEGLIRERRNSPSRRHRLSRRPKSPDAARPESSPR